MFEAHEVELLGSIGGPRGVIRTWVGPGVHSEGGSPPI
jgi:hypothetical protein